MTQSWHPRDGIPTVIPPSAAPWHSIAPSIAPSLGAVDCDALEELRATIEDLRTQIVEERERHEVALAAEQANLERSTEAYRKVMAGMRKSFAAQVEALRKADNSYPE